MTQAMASPKRNAAAQTTAPSNGWIVGQHAGCAQHQGLRANMEDAVLLEMLTTAGGLSLLVALVADGIGGENAGEVAANIACDTVREELKAAATTQPNELPGLLNDVLSLANQRIYEQARRNKEQAGMGTTAALAVVALSTNQLYVANAGDSRVYLIRGDAEPQQLTRDHIWAEQMVQEGKLSLEEAQKHPKAEELVRSIGYGPRLQVDLGLYLNGQSDELRAIKEQGLTLQPGDRIVVCSDGLIKLRRNDPTRHYVEPAEIGRLVRQYAPPMAAEKLVQLAAVSRQADDNVSLIVLETPGSQRSAVPLTNRLSDLVGSLPVSPRNFYLATAVLAFILLVALFVNMAGGNDGDSPDPTLAVQAPIGNVPGEGDGDAHTPTVTLTPENPVWIIQWVSQNDGATVTVDGTPGAREEDLLLMSGQTLIVRAAEEPVTFMLSDDKLFLSAAGEIEIKDRERKLLAGKLVVQAIAQEQTWQNRFGSQAVVAQNGIAGLETDVNNPALFALHCFAGACTLKGDQAEDVLMLEGGQSSIIRGSGRPSEVEAANYLSFSQLASGIIPTPTATMTPTNTSTPTLTPTQTKTPHPPTPTASPSATATSATPTPDSGSPGGGGAPGSGGLPGGDPPTPTPDL